MRRAFLALGAVSIGLAGCAAGAATGGGGSGGGSTAATLAGPSTGSFGDASGTGGAPSCAKFTAEGKQQSAAMLIVLDRSASMTTSNKWGTAQQAVVAAVDQDSFDSLSLGLITFPQSFTTPPNCLCQYACGSACDSFCLSLFGQGVSCGVGGLPEVAINSAGTSKSNDSSGVRHDIYQFLVNHQPLSNQDDGSPIYDAMVSGYSALKLQNVEKRMLVLITDGGFSCTSVSSPTRPGYSDGACPDWEYPDTVNALISQQRTDPTTPINTFIVGLPGSNSHGEMQGAFATAPYSMLLALSTYAVSGSPETVDPACDSSVAFTQGGTDPAAPCHIDLTSGSFDASKLADAINAIRGKALGCTYDLPDPPPGESIDPNQVNVQATTSGMTATLPKRSDPSDMCTTTPCWDYTADQKVQLIGQACDDVTSGLTTKVEIYVGCETIVK